MKRACAMVMVGVLGLAASRLAWTQSGGASLREIDDPATGARWLLERDAQHPSGPGRLVEVASPRREPRTSPFPPAPVIRAGDRVVLETHTAVMDAHLVGVAMMPAAKGSVFPLRLTAGGPVLHAVALGSGRAEWLPDAGARP